MCDSLRFSVCQGHFLGEPYITLSLEWSSFTWRWILPRRLFSLQQCHVRKSSWKDVFTITQKTEPIVFLDVSDVLSVFVFEFQSLLNPGFISSTFTKHFWKPFAQRKLCESFAEESFWDGSFLETTEFALWVSGDGRDDRNPHQKKKWGLTETPQVTPLGELR